jgi:bifunctional non-homologous end joining protein LigD
VAQALEGQISKALGPGRVEVDPRPNAAGRAALCAYSLCGSERPLVSLPLAWDEVEDALASGKADILALGVDEALERVEAAGDLFAPVLSERQELPELGMS